MTTVSVVMPALDEADNLLELHGRLASALASTDYDWEWVVVDDHSTDGTDEVLARLVAADEHVRAVRLSRTFGSHAAIACGLAAAHGDVVVVMAADQQDDPADVARLLHAWAGGAQVVWGTRSERERTSRLYEAVVRRLVGERALPPTGTDVVALDRVVVDAAVAHHEVRAHLFMLVAWLGFRQAEVPLTRSPRVHGQSRWTLSRKVDVALDSVTSFTERPLRWVGGAGLAVALVGLVYAVVVLVAALLGDQPEGWSSLMVVTLVLSGGQLLMLGVLGAYVWRGLGEVRRRPAYVVESRLGEPGCEG